MNIYRLAGILVGIAVLLCLSCIDWANPYKDMTKAEVVVDESSEIQDGDTLISGPTASRL